ncbi:MAG: hypothetical protein KJ927_03895, partial [Candidatus Eisenbacteria bacterium]|nr:hypothetical protein [Candidatus Eisenbacteria bacterium]
DERSSQWKEIGSVNQAGRTHAAAPSSDGASLYIGANHGGIWKGTIDGRDWVALSDGLGMGSNQILVVPPGYGPLEPEIVFTLRPGFASYGNEGTIHASSNGGQTWFVPEGVPDDIYESRRIVHDPSHPRTVYYLSRSRQYLDGGGYDYGFIISRSTDGGLTFEKRIVFPANPRCDLWIDRVAGGPIYVMAGGTIYRSDDQAASFQEVGTASTATVADVVLTGSEAGAPHFYAALQEGGQWKLYRSSNAGQSWAWKHDIDDFWETLLASITDPNLVFYAGVECWRSTSGGSAFNKVNNWYDYYGNPEGKLHADLPGMNAYMVGGQEAIYFNTDGGTFVSYDGGITIHNVSLWGLGVSQYYDTFTSQNDPYLIVAGAQDQGYQQSYHGSRGALIPFNQLISGDYGHLASTIRDHNWLYSVYPGFILIQKNETAPQYLFQLDFPTQSCSWMPSLTADPFDAEAFYFCGDHLWHCKRIENNYTYEMIEGSQDFSSGGFLTGLAISTADSEYWYGVTNDGKMWFSHNAGLSWTQSDHGPGSQYFYGTSIVASPGDRELAYAGGSGYLGHPIWRTTDGGLTWEPFSDGLPFTLVLELALGDDAGETPYAACEAGPYRYEAGAAQWVSILGTEAPLTCYWCVEWVPEIGVMRFGTYGRGIWDFWVPPASSSVDERNPGGYPNETFHSRLVCSPNPAHGPIEIRYRTATAGKVRVELFDISGRRIADLLNGHRTPGDHQFSFSPSTLHLGAGAYPVRLVTPDGVAVETLHIVR